MASPNLSEIVTTTLRNRSGKLADNTLKNNALLMRLQQRGNAKPISGGSTILHELEYQENATFQWYSGYQVLNITPSDVFTSAEFQWKQAAVAVSISGLEGKVQNTGPERSIDLMESRIKNAEKTMMNNMSTGVYSAGTASGGKQIGGLQLLVPDDPTAGTVGGISRVNWSFWRSQLWRTSTDGTGHASSSNIQTYMNQLYLKCVRGRDAPDLIVFDSTYYAFYLASLQTIQRITDEKLGSAGFQNLKYMGGNCDVVLDGGLGGAAPAVHGYFLNTDYIHYRPHRDVNMVPLDDVQSINQDATVKLIVWAGNMTASNLSLQGVMFDD